MDLINYKYSNLILENEVEFRKSRRAQYAEHLKHKIDGQWGH